MTEPTQPDQSGTKPKTVLIATGNKHKVAEIRDILGEGFLCLCLKDVPGAPVVVEDAPTIEGNAVKKAVEISQFVTGKGVPEVDFVLADDTGLEVDALRGRPGVRSARYAGGSSQPGEPIDQANNRKLLRELKTAGASAPPQRRARFRCVMALAAHGWLVRSFEGVCEGVIVDECRGQGGFGYDPLFEPRGFDCTFAELGDGEKNRISHRFLALDKVRAFLTEQARD